MMDYRREVDGLRALSVIPVIFFHAGFSLFSGGYVGVDVFFVISGYLITGIVMNEVQQGTFSIVDFYERRIRRILPALFLVVACCVPAAYVILLPSDMKEFSQSLIAVAIYLSHLIGIGVAYKLWEQTGWLMFCPTWLVYLSLCASGIGLGVLMSRWIEYPLMRIVRSLLPIRSTIH